MLDLRFWLREQELSVRELAVNLEVPLKTVEDWVYRGVVPSPENMGRMNEFISESCTHHWVIDSANGPLSKGVCQRCGGERDFKNSTESTPWPNAQRSKAQQVKS